MFINFEMHKSNQTHLSLRNSGISVIVTTDFQRPAVPFYSKTSIIRIFICK